MPKQFNRSLSILLFTLFLLSACSRSQSPTEVDINVTTTPTNTGKIIVPLPLPTTLPNQQAELENASKNKVNSVDFVIDTTELEANSIPFRFKNGENIYKYTSSDEAYTVLLHGSNRPSRLIGFESIVFDSSVQYLGVIAANSTGLATNEVMTFSDPLLTSSELTPDEYLELLTNSLLDGAISLAEMASVNVINQENIQLNDYPGRDFTLEVQPFKDGNASFNARLRVYIVGNTVYQLYAKDVLDNTAFNNENTIRFLDSFTLNE
jgi:hypothetical protein